MNVGVDVHATESKGLGTMVILSTSIIYESSVCVRQVIKFFHARFNHHND